MVYLYSYLRYTIYTMFFLILAGYFGENDSKLANLLKLHKKCAIYFVKWLSRIRIFNITVTIIILFKMAKK